MSRQPGSPDVPAVAATFVVLDRFPAQRWWALGALVPSGLTVGFDVTIMNVALPTITQELSAGTATLQWIVNSYVPVFAA